MRSSGILLLITLLAAGCTAQVVFDSEGQRLRFITNQNQYDEQRFNSNASDAYNLLSVEIMRDSLYFEVQYGGGCSRVDFTLTVGDQQLPTEADSLAIRPSVLTLKDTDDCEALITTQVPIALQDLPRGPYQLFVYNPGAPGEAVTITIP